MLNYNTELINIELYFDKFFCLEGGDLVTPLSCIKASRSGNAVFGVLFPLSYFMARRTLYVHKVADLQHSLGKFLLLNGSFIPKVIPYEKIA